MSRATATARCRTAWSARAIPRDRNVRRCRTTSWSPCPSAPAGLEFTRAVIEMTLLRNLNDVRSGFPKFESRVVPDHVYDTLDLYSDLYEQTVGRPLAPTAAEASSEGSAEGAMAR